MKDEGKSAAQWIACFVCGSQRIGSNVLCEALTPSGVAGRPTEHFVPSFEGDATVGHVHAGFERSAWARGRGIETFPEFFDAVLRDGSTPNGVFSTKLMWNAFDAFLDKLAELPDCRPLAPAAFPQPRFVFLRRRNRVRQAVSWALAAQTGHFSTAAAATRAPFATPAFDIELLDGLYRLIREADEGWSAFFERTGVEPLCLWYEDLAPDLDATLARVLAWLELPASDARVAGRLCHQPQATALNAEWEARYRALRPGA